MEELKEEFEIGTQCYDDLEEVLRSATTTDEIMQLFWKTSCHFPYLHELNALMAMLSLTEATKEIEKYEKKQEEAYKTVLAEHFAELAVQAYDRDNNVEVMCALFQMGRFW